MGAVNSQSDASISCFISVIHAPLDLWKINICFDGRFQRADRLFDDFEIWAVRCQHFELRVRTQLFRAAMCRGSIVNEYYVLVRVEVQTCAKNSLNLSAFIQPMMEE